MIVIRFEALIKSEEGDRYGGSLHVTVDGGDVTLSLVESPARGSVTGRAYVVVSLAELNRFLLALPDAE